MFEDLEADVVQAMCKAKLVVNVLQEPCSIEDLELVDHQVLLPIVHHVILIHLQEVVQVAVLVIVIGLFLIHQVPGISNSTTELLHAHAHAISILFPGFVHELVVLFHVVTSIHRSAVLVHVCALSIC